MIKIETGEKIIKIVRRHYLVMIPAVIILLLAALAPAALMSLVFSGIITMPAETAVAIENFVSKWKIFSYSIWLLALWIIFFIEWTDYYLDLWIITDKRIIDVEQKGFFDREVTSFRYQQIQDITVETRGILRTFLKFGTLHIQTAGHNREIIITDADHPENVRSLILDLQQRTKNDVL